MPSTSGSCFSRATRFSINRDRAITRPSCCMCAERTPGDSSCAPSILPVEHGNVPVLAVSQARRTHSGWHHVTRVSRHPGAVGRYRKLGVPEARGQRGPLDFFGRIGISWDARMACPEGLEPPTYCLEGNCSIRLSYGQVWPLTGQRGSYPQWAGAQGLAACPGALAVIRRRLLPRKPPKEVPSRAPCRSSWAPGRVQGSCRVSVSYTHLTLPTTPYV